MGSFQGLFDRLTDANKLESQNHRLRRLIPPPTERGAYVGDTYYPVGGTEASHFWDGQEWQWVPELAPLGVGNAEAV